MTTVRGKGKRGVRELTTQEGDYIIPDSEMIAGMGEGKTWGGRDRENKRGPELPKDCNYNSSRLKTD